MKLLKQFESLVVDDFEEAIYSYPKHSHTYFEIVYIHKGYGQHYFNQNILPYQKGDCFLLAPGDHHFFDITGKTRFTFIKFTDSYFKSHRALCPDLLSEASPEAIMKDRALKENLLKLDEPAKKVLQSIVGNIVCYNEHGEQDSPVIFYQLLSLLSLFKQAIQRMNKSSGQKHPNTEQLSSYLHQYIYNRNMLKINHVAAHFKISPKYFSTYFKRTYNINYRDYLERYRMQLVEKRLANKKISLKQIILEFEFTDESHLNKAFKRYKGLSPLQYRKLDKAI